MWYPPLTLKSATSSNKVWMFHRHIEALLYHWVVSINVGAWTNNRLGSLLMVNACIAFRPETLLARIENDTGILKLLISWLIHGLGAFRINRSGVLIQARAWHLKLETLPVEDLVIIEARGGCIKADTLSGNWLIVASPGAMVTPNILLLDASDLILDAEDGFFVIDMLALFTLCHDLGSFASLAFQDADIWVVRHHVHGETIRLWSEDSVAHHALLGKCCIHTADRVALRVGAFTHDGEIDRWFRDVRLDVVGARARVLITNVQPAIFDSCRIRAKNSKLDPLRLRQCPVLSNLRQALADGGVVWVVDVDVGAGTWIRSFNILVAFSLLLLIEGNLDRFFLQEPTLDVVALLLVDGVLAWTRVHEICLFGKWCIKLILPKVTSHGRAHEGIWILTASRGRACPKFRVLHRRVHRARLASRCLRKNIAVVAWPWLVILDLWVLAVGHFGQKDARVALWIECFLFFCDFNILLVIWARSGVLARRELLVLDVNRGFKYLTLILRRLEIADWSSSLGSVHVGVVQSWSNGVLTTARVHINIDLLRWDRGRLGPKLVNLIFVLVAEVFGTRSVQVWSVSHELETGHVTAWVRICQISWWLINTRSRSSWAETRNLTCKHTSLNSNKPQILRLSFDYNRLSTTAQLW